MLTILQEWLIPILIFILINNLDLILAKTQYNHNYNKCNKNNRNRSNRTPNKHNCRWNSKDLINKYQRKYLINHNGTRITAL